MGRGISMVDMRGFPLSLSLSPSLSQDHQLNEVSVMKEVLENEMASLQRERDLLSGEVEEGSEERENLEREVQATRAELAEAEGEVKRLV